MDDIMKTLKGKMQPVQGKEKENKMQVLQHLIHEMSMLMADEGHMKPMDGAEVKIQAHNPEDLQKGLKMAQNVVEQSGDEMPMGDDSMSQDPAGESMPDDEDDLEEEDYA